ncbi:unnamed protein product [Staurois parvus]|uniref:Uncharacterized protein n=1 Tax=Staurois parvus TaxID=386267 RepID=A0ABN9AS59_9NEOB|nr:unnamed protein product [Staurois parvus]
MDTDRWRCWGYTDHHQGTLIISALMICLSLFTCDQL